MDNYKLVVDNGYFCDICSSGHDACLEIWHSQDGISKRIYVSDNFYSSEDDIKLFREKVQLKLNELNIVRDLSSDYIGDWEDED